MGKIPGNQVRGSQSGRPIMVLFDSLGQRWTLRILWELRDERLSFRELQSRCGEISPTILNKRIKELRELKLIDHETPGYAHTKRGRELGIQLAKLNRWADDWAQDLV